LPAFLKKFNLYIGDRVIGILDADGQPRKPSLMPGSMRAAAVIF
jgi:hypothetical protein